MNNLLNAAHEDMMAMSAEELDAWLEDIETEELLNPTNLEECPWILMPSTMTNGIPHINAAGQDPKVFIKWSMGELSWYIVEFDGEDTVGAYLVNEDTNASPAKSLFQVSQISELTFFSDKQTWRVYRDINWNPNTRLSSVLKKAPLPPVLEDDPDVELVF